MSHLQPAGAATTHTLVNTKGHTRVSERASDCVHLIPTIHQHRLRGGGTHVCTSSESAGRLSDMIRDAKRTNGDGVVVAIQPVASHKGNREKFRTANRAHESSQRKKTPFTPDSFSHSAQKKRMHACQRKASSFNPIGGQTTALRPWPSGPGNH